MKELKELMIEKLEELEWRIVEDDEGAELGKFSDAGEDFWMYIRYKTPFEMSEEINRYYEDFDPEEHALTMLGASGNPGIRRLIEDADSIDDMIRELSVALSDIVEKWCEEHGIDGSET